MAEAIDELGLDISSFHKAIEQAKADLNSMSPALKALDAELAKMAQMSKQAGDAARQHATEVVNLRNQLRAVQKDYNAQSIGSENSPEQKARKARIDSLKQELAEKQKIASISKKTADSLASDYKNASEERDKLAPAIQRGDAARQRKQDQEERRQDAEDAKARRAEEANGKRSLATFVAVVYLAAKAAKWLSDNFLALGENAIKASQTYQAGGSKLDANVGSKNSAGFSVGISSLVSDQIAKLKKGAAEVTGSILQNVGYAFAKLTGGSEGADNFTAGVLDIEEKGRALLSLNDSLVAAQDDLAEIQKKQTGTVEDKYRIQQKSLEISKLQKDIADHEFVQNREAANSAKAQTGELTLQFKAQKQQQLDTISTTTEETKKIERTQKGYARIAELSKMRLDYEVKIQDALRTGQDKLAKQLVTQRDLLVLASAVAEKNMTARERIAERNAGRKFATDVTKVGRQSLETDRSLENANVTDESSLDKAIKEGRITRGSRLDRAARAKFSGSSADAYAQSAMSIKQMNVQTITSTNLNIATPP